MGKDNTTNHVNEVLDSQIAESVAVATKNDLVNKVNVDDRTAYIIADSFTGNPYQLLGQVIEVRKKDGQCPEDFSATYSKFDFSPFPVKGFKMDAETRLKKPELRSSIIVNKGICAKVGFLSYLQAELDEKSTFSLMIFDQAKGLVDFQDDGWTTGLRNWMKENADRVNDPEICYIYVVSGFVQKNIVRKKYIQFEVGTKGGAYGINIEGKLSTSTEDYSLDIIFGLTPAIIKRPRAPQATRGLTWSTQDASFSPSTDELRLFASASGSAVQTSR
jgi:hypothetical protein